MHIVFDARWIRDRKLDGIGRYTLELLQQFVLLGKDHHWTVLVDQQDTAVWLHSRLGKSSASLQFQVMETSILHLKDICKLRQVITKLKPDVVLTPHYLSYPFVRGVPVVMVIHDLIPYLRPELRKTLKWKLFYRFKFQLRYVFNKAAQLVVDSDATRHDVKRLFGINEDKIARVYAGVNDRFFEAVDVMERRAVKLKYHLPERYILCVSRQQAYKNLLGLAKAYDLLPPQIKERYKLVLTGERHRLYNDDLMEKLAPLLAKGQLMFTGYLDDADLPGLYQDASVFCLPSLSEGFGLPVLEAMASGTPVACSRVASLPEVGGAAAAYFDPMDVQDMRDKLLELIEEGKNAVRVEAGREQARQFRWETTAGEVLKLLEKVVAGAEG